MSDELVTFVDPKTGFEGTCEKQDVWFFQAMAFFNGVSGGTNFVP